MPADPFDNTPAAAAPLPGRWADCRTVGETNQDVQSLAAGSTVGGVTLVEGDRVLLAAQTAGADNGLWVIVPGGATRPTDFDAGADLEIAKVVRVSAGSRAGSQWALVTAGPYTLGTTALVFRSGAGAVTIGASYDNTAPTAASLPVIAFDNTSPDASSPLAPAYDNAAPGAVSVVTPFSNTPPEAIVLPGETAPTTPIQTPAGPTVIAHTTTLVQGTNYLVQAGTRAAPVTITLPDPGATGQRIEVVDASSQAAAYPITVNAGTRDIEVAGTHTFVINRNDAVLAIYWTGTKWKIL